MTKRSQKNFVSILVVFCIVFSGFFLWTHWQDLFVEGQHLLFRTIIHKPAPHLSRMEVKELDSEALGGVKRKIAVYLPPYYDQNSDKRYPVLYLLHGDPGTYEDWVINADIQTVLDDAIALRTVPSMIVVMPDGNGPNESAGQYLNSTLLHQNLEDYVTKELVGYIDEKYRTVATRRARALGGNSSGAFGAANLGLKHSDEFSVLLVLNGYFDLGNDAKKFFSKNTEIFSNTPIKYLESLSLDPQTYIYLNIGEQDKSEWIDQNHRVDEMLSSKNIIHTLDIEQGEHNWEVWRHSIVKGLVFLGKHLSATEN